ncbi:uncharacterized protein LOC131656167 [Vicia villosa]|uniref:uncharacterized protein LOC131656167 n=1 Tax=Vicia villosa TaxID=3911 RepID=UPI00273AEE45|nr:uncharacterized protein LOC131656167 [Vicia villosa]
MKNGKRTALSDLTNSSHLSSSSVSSSATIEPIKKNQINIRKTCLTPLHDVKPSTVHRTKNQNNTVALPTTLTVRCKKKQRVVSNEQEDLEDYIEKQKAYFKQIDEYELEEEEVEEYTDE